MRRQLLDSLIIPYDFDTRLPELKEKTFKWKVDVKLQNEKIHSGTITHYSIGDEPRGNFILVPGLASNTDIEPLMRALTYWSLTHQYNIYCLDTFLGEFKPRITMADAQRNTVPNFIKLMDTSLDIIEKYCANTWTCLVGHSLGATIPFEVFNQRLLTGKKLRISAAIMFAPFVTNQWHQFLLNLYRKRNFPQGISDKEYKKTAIGLISPYDVALTGTTRYISILPSFFDEIEKVTIKPHLANKYDIPITIVAGGRDKKAPLEHLREIYNSISKTPNGKLFKFVVFPNSKHSFIDQYKQWTDILNLIRSQRIRKKQQSR